MPASSNAVPVAERRFNLNIAASGVGFGATGGILITALWSSGTGICGAYHESSRPLIWGIPQAKTKAVRKIHGSHAFHAGEPAASAAAADVGPDVGAGFACSSAGFQNRISTTTENNETPPATMSTSHGPWKLLTRNCTRLNDAPATMHAGQTETMPRQPTCAATSQKGTMSEKNGSWRPTIALSWSRSRPVSGASVTRGVPSEPKATGAVLPMSASLAASSGLKPSPISRAPEIATGAPKPAAPSMKAPNENAIRSD